MICLDPNDPTVSRLGCDHCFHATCLVPALTRDPWCPCCRFFPRDFVHPDELVYDDEYDSEDDTPAGPSFKDAVQSARGMAKTDKKIQRSMKVITKWKQARKDARKTAKELQNKLRPLEDKLDDKVEACTKKLYDAFDLKNANLIESLKDARKKERHARTQYHNARYRLAEKGGWRNTRCSWRRRRNRGV